MKQDAERTTFSDDAPKTDPKSEDDLGFRGFAEQLAEFIIGTQASNGYVIGLQGAWGSGKSTIINFSEFCIKEKMRKDKFFRDTFSILRYQPWLYSGHTDLIAAFFKDLSTHLDPNRNRKRKRWKFLSEVISSGIDPAAEAAAKLGFLIDPTSGIASQGVLAMSKKFGSKSLARWQTELSLQEIYEDLFKILTESNKKILVIIDDMDRLDDDEIRSMMKMVKSVGRLPNLVYLLSYDKEIVWKALQHSQNRENKYPQYGEKIVQHERDVPTPTKSYLFGMLDKNIHGILDDYPGTTRWLRILSSGVHRYIRNPRDVIRLSNSVQFSWHSLRNEIDPADLLTMECIRMHDRPLFEWIKYSRDFFFLSSGVRYTTEEELFEEGDRFRLGLPTDYKEQVIDLTCALFPHRERYLRGKDTTWELFSESESERLERRGVSTEIGYDAYFSLYVDDASVLKSDIDAASANLDSSEVQEKLLLKYLSKKGPAGTPLAGEYLREMRYRLTPSDDATERQQNASSVELLFVLARHANILQGLDRPNVGFSSARSEMFFLVEIIFRKLPPISAQKIFGQLCNTPEYISFCAEVWTIFARQAGLIETDGRKSSALFTGDFLRTLAIALSSNISKQSSEKTLIDLPYYFHILHVWSFVSGGQEPAAWISKNLFSDRGFLEKLTIGMTGYSQGTRGNLYRFFIDGDRSYYDLGAILAACEEYLGVDVPPITEDGRRRVEAVLYGLRQKFSQRE